MKLEYSTKDGLKFSAPYFMRTAYVRLSTSSTPAEITSIVLLDRDKILSRYCDASATLGKGPPTDAEIEQVCRDVQEAIVARERGLHSASLTVPAVKVLFVPKVQSDQGAVRLLDAVETADRL